MLFNNNGRPLSKRKQVQVMVALTILAWATQTLLTQWAHGAEATERFADTDLPVGFGTTVELRAEASVVGGEVKLRQICRWSDADAPAMQRLGDLVVAHLDDTTPFVSLSVPELKAVLRQGGANLGTINFVGSARCDVNRSDAAVKKEQSLDQWIAAQAQKPSPAVVTTPQPEKAVAVNADPAHPTLKQKLMQELATRLKLNLTDLQVDFRAQDEQTLNLSTALFQFQIEPIRSRRLGNIGWEVVILAEGSSRKVQVSATARAWQNQTVAVKPLGTGQIIQETDVEERRTLVDSLGTDTLATKAQCVGQLAGRDLKPGMVIESKQLSPVQLIKQGQLVLVDVKSGGVNVTAVARALENGAFGQSVKVKNETTRETFLVTVTASQRGEMCVGGDLKSLMRN